MSTELEHYDRLYSLHERGERSCRESIHSLEKARKRLMRSLEYFDIDLPRGATALDVGCGLGYFTQALSEQGFRALGIDISGVAIEAARKKFPEPNFKRASFPEDIAATYDLVWTVDLSGFYSFDPQVIGTVILSCLRRLNPGGVLVIGRHTDFSGDIKDKGANWDLDTLERVCTAWGLEGPAIVEARIGVVNFLLIHLCRLRKKSAPIFLAKKT